MANKIQFKRGASSSIPTLSEGEPAFCLDTHEMYIGNGSTNYKINFEILDEDAMTSNSATNPASQQSVKAYVTTSISSLIDSSPATLNTLNELAAALGDDASFATTVTTSIGTKLTKTSNLSDLSSVTTARTNLGVDAAGTINYSISSDLLDEDAMTSNSATKPASQQSIKAYIAENAAGGGGGSGFPLLIPDNMDLDDTNVNVDFGSAFNMIKTIDFGPSTDGSVWISFHMLSSLDATTDIKLDLIYSLNGADNSKSIRFQTAYWCNGIGETPSLSSPIATNTNAISTGTSANGKIQKTTLTALPNASITSNDVIVLKFTRDASDGSDTYTGTFQLLHVIPYQD